MVHNNQAVRNLLKKVPTPLYLYDFFEIRKRISIVKGNFPPETSLYYSMKANPNISLIRAMGSQIAGIDVASLGELTAILESGLNIGNIIFHGPSKCEASLKMAINHNIKAIVVDSFNEIDQISSVCSQSNKNANVMIRINPSFTPKGYKFSLSGPKHIKLGIDESDVQNVIDSIKKASSRIKLIGFHCYLGSRMLDNDAYLYNVEQITQLFEKYIHYVDSDEVYLAFASGIGATYYPEEQPFCFDGVKQFITNKLLSLSNRFGKKINHILELGSYLVVDSGYYITKIVNLKQLNGYKVAITDGGINHNLSCIYRSTWEQRSSEDSHPLRVIHDNSQNSKDLQKYDIFGPICSEVDCLAKNALLPTLKIGDHIVAGKSGAYCLTDSVVLFLSNGIPAEYLLDGDQIKQIKPRQPGAEYLRKTFDCVEVM